MKLVVTVRCWLGVACVLCALGCDDLSEFKTKPGEVFSGEVVGSDSEQGDSSFIRQGFTSHTQMQLEFDPAHATLSAEVDAGGGATSAGAMGPGRLTTYVCPNGARSCEKEQRIAHPFSAAPLLSIPELSHDALSEYTFPGGGRIRNYIFGARFETTLPRSNRPVQRHAMVFVSLMENGDIEVRVIAPNVVAADGETELSSALFGVFVLGRHKT